MAAERVGLHCSNPNCQKLTSGPAVDPSRAIKVGEAAHITAAAPGGARYDPALTPAQRRSIDNAIWLCAGCATMIDRDADQFSVAILREWRALAEARASRAIAASNVFRSIAATEIRQEMSVGELVAIKELEEEFGCHLETNIYVPAGDGWIRLDGAVVRGEDLIAVEVREVIGSGIAYFQIEALLELCAAVKFDRFPRCALYVVVISNAPTEVDADVAARLRQLTDASTVETHIRLYRLNTLRAKFGI